MATEQLEDVLNDYVASIETPTHDALQEWIKKFPQYETDLTEFTVAWIIMETLTPMTKPTHGGKRTPGPGKKLGPPKKAERYRHRNITLPPTTDDMLKEWAIAVDNDISALINRLVIDFFRKESE